MKTDDFNFDLPGRLIAQHPTGERGASRMLVLDRATTSTEHSEVARLVRYIEPGTLMVFNDSRVRKARIDATLVPSGSPIEFLLLRRLGPDRWTAACKKLGRQKRGRRYLFPEGVEAEAEGQSGDTLVLAFSRPVDDSYLDRVGRIPLPPYIRRKADKVDEQRYQTVYSRHVGSAASPTAGLHFTGELMRGLADAGVRMANVTLHVGLGTFLPVHTPDIEDHLMHVEDYSIPGETALQVASARAEGRKILAVGTTSLRTLESAWDGDSLSVGDGSTDIFIYPGYRFRVVDMLFTNFHTPRSTLLMLVSAFAGRERILGAYAEAVAREYRFFSYGDAMLIR